MFDSKFLRPLAAFIALAPSCVLATETIDEIVVTADLLNRPATDVPASVSLIDKESIEAQAVQHFEELINTIPNLNWSGDGHRARYFQIRGIGERSQYEGAPNPSVGFIVDDIDFSGIGTIATLFDVERIEVLRGPQAIRYGANALAGLIYVRSVEPLPGRENRVQLTLGDDDAYSLGAAVGGSLGTDERAAFRLSGHYHESNGFRDNAYLGRSDSNGRRETVLRGKLHYALHRELSLSGTLMYANIDNGYDAFAIDNSRTVLSDKPGRDAQESVGASLRIEWEGLRNAVLTSITSGADSNIDFSFDADWGNAESWAPFTYDFESVNDRQRTTLSQEVRLAANDDAEVQWLAGLYAMRLEEDLVTLSFGDYADPGVFAGDFDAPPFDSAYEATSAAAFGQLVVPVASATDVDIGLRVERRSTDYRDSNGINASPSETMFGGHIALSHQFSERLAGFAGVSRGYKAGGFNLGVVPEGRRDFGYESLWSLEAGMRARWLDDRLRLSATLFYSDREDQQVQTSFQIDPNDPVSFVFFTDNATGSKSVGLEAELRVTPNDRWQYYVNVGLLDTEFDAFVTAEVDNSGRELAHAPDYTIAAGVAWQHPRGWFARIDSSARDEFFFSDSHDQRSDAYVLTNLRVGFASESWRADLWARNVFDKDYAVRGFYFGNEPPDFPDALYTRLGDPRQVGITIERSF